MSNSEDDEIKQSRIDSDIHYVHNQKVRLVCYLKLF
jgi:hypothetical protein